jgi:hypothetical protein
MSLSRHTLKRLQTIQEGILQGDTREQIGTKCGVTEKTIDRDMNAWVDSGLFEVWLKREFLRLHASAIHESPLDAYREVAKLVGKMLTRKIEKKEQVEIREKVEIDITELLAKYEPALTRARHSNIRPNNPSEQVDPPQANAETS